MKKPISCFLLIGVCLLWAATVQAKVFISVPGGEVHGDWGSDDAAKNSDSVYVISEGCLVPAGQSLYIHAGINIQFTGTDALVISGDFMAEGTDAYPVHIEATSECEGFQFEGVVSDTAVLSHVQFADSPCPAYAIRSRDRVIVLSDCKISARLEAISCENASAIITGCKITKTGAGEAAIYLDRASNSQIQNTGIKVRFSTPSAGLYTDGVRIHQTPDMRIENSRVEIVGRGFVTGIYSEFDCSPLLVSQTSVYAESENDAAPRGIWLTSAGYCDVLDCSLHVESNSTLQALVYLAGQTSARVFNSYLYLGGAGLGQFILSDETAQSRVLNCVMLPINRAPGRNESSLTSRIHVGVKTPFPNPFNSVVTMPLELSRPSVVELVVFDALGRQVHRSSCGLLSEGQHTLSLSGNSWASGVYFVQWIVDSKPLPPMRIVLVK